MNNIINRKGTPIVGAIEPIDDDLALTADYLMREATPEQVAEFERRFVEDGEFYDKVAPAVKAWTLPVTFGEIMERVPEPAPQHALPTTAPVVLAVPATTVIPFAKPRSLRKGRFIRRVMRTATLLQTAAAVVFVALYGLLYWNVLRPDRPNELTQAINAKNAATAPLGAPTAASIQPAPVIPSSRATGAPISTAPRARPDTGLAEHAFIRAVVAAMGVEVRTGDDETKLFELSNGIRILLRPNSSFHYLTTRLMPSGVAISFEGELSVDLPASDDNYLGATLVASEGSITVTRARAYNEAAGKYLPVPTQFAARCYAGCAAVEVAVASGNARISSADGLSKITLEAGQFGLAHATLPPTFVEPDKATSFPVPDLTLRRKP